MQNRNWSEGSTVVKEAKRWKLDSKWLGPFKIRKNLGKGLHYISDDGNIKAASKRVHGTHLKLYYCSSSISDKVKKSIDILEASQEPKILVQPIY